MKGAWVYGFTPVIAANTARLRSAESTAARAAARDQRRRRYSEEAKEWTEAAMERFARATVSEAVALADTLVITAEAKLLGFALEGGDDGDAEEMDNVEEVEGEKRE